MVKPTAETTSRTTLASIAKEVGVSVNTVSRALRAPETVRLDLRRRILAARDALNYVPNRLAGGLAGTRSNVVGVIVTSLFHSEFAEVVDTLQSVLLEHDFQVMLGNSRYDPDEELRLLRSILSWRPAALAIIGVDHHPQVSDLLRTAGAPVVEMWDIGDAVIDSGVGMDHVAIGRAQAHHLADGGARCLAFLGSARRHDTRALKRLRGVQAGADERGLKPPVIRTREEPGSADLGESLIRELLREAPDVDGVVCNSDAVALGVLRGLRRLGVSVPESCQVIGFGATDAGTCTQPSLSTIAPPREVIGRTTARLLLARMRDLPPERVAVTWTLVPRGSTRADAERPAGAQPPHPQGGIRSG